MADPVVPPEEPQPQPHEFTEDVDDYSMCLCGIPALTHDEVMATVTDPVVPLPEQPAETATDNTMHQWWPTGYTRCYTCQVCGEKAQIMEARHFDWPHPQPEGKPRCTRCLGGCRRG